MIELANVACPIIGQFTSRASATLYSILWTTHVTFVDIGSTHGLLELRCSRNNDTVFVTFSSISCQSTDEIMIFWWGHYIMMFIDNVRSLYYHFCLDSHFHCFYWFIIKIQRLNNKFNGYQNVLIHFIVGLFPQVVSKLCWCRQSHCLKYSCSGLWMTCFCRPFLPFSCSPIHTLLVSQEIEQQLIKNSWYHHTWEIPNTLNSHCCIKLVSDKFQVKRSDHSSINESLT